MSPIVAEGIGAFIAVAVVVWIYWMTATWLRKPKKPKEGGSA